MQVVPTILEKSFDEAERKIELVKDLVSWIQIDVIDGVFCYGKTFELELVKRLDFDVEDKSFEIHLMVKEPKNWISKCNFVGAARVVGHVEMMEDREEFVKKVKDLNMEAGLAIDIKTEIGEVPVETDMVLLMGRKAGFDSRGLNRKVFDKIGILKQFPPGATHQRRAGKQDDSGAGQDDRGRGGDGTEARFKIGVDGGVNRGNIEKLREAGVDVVYCGSAIFDGNVKENLEVLKNKANEKNK